MWILALLTSRGIGQYGQNWREHIRIEWPQRRYILIEAWHPPPSMYCTMYILHAWMPVMRDNQIYRAENSLIGFPTESLVFYPKMSEWAIRWKKWAIHSFANFWWATWVIHSRSLISSEGPVDHYNQQALFRASIDSNRYILRFFLLSGQFWWRALFITVW